jgi:hypothetical protein
MGKPGQKFMTGVDNESAPVLASNDPPPSLLAVDCGLKTGLALFDLNGTLLWYRSHNFGSRQRLKKAVWQILSDLEGLSQLVVEGGGDLVEIWRKTAQKRGINVSVVQAVTWRKDLLLPRQQRTGKQAKQVADELARGIIEQAGAAKPTSLRHDAAEAILVGWWATRHNKIKQSQSHPDI